MSIALTPCLIKAADKPKTWKDIFNQGPKIGVGKCIENTIAKIYNILVLKRIEKMFGAKNTNDKITQLTTKIAELRNTKGVKKKHITTLLIQLNKLLEEQNKKDKK